jgi:hypothetical protein
MNNYTRNWDAGTVQLEHLFLNDPEAKIRDAMANADDGEVVACYGATNRMLTRSEYSSAYEADEISALAKKRMVAEHELLKRMRGARK